MKETRRPLYSFSILLPHRANEVGWSCEWPDAGAESRAQILTAQSFRCFYCAEPITQLTITDDHLYPISRGGCGCIGNLVGACRSCNGMKRDKLLQDFLRERPSFLRTMGEFSTRVLYFKRDALFWDYLAPNVRALAVMKRMPSPEHPTAAAINRAKAHLQRQA